MFSKTLSSAGFFAGALVATLLFLGFQLYGIYRTRDIAGRMLTGCAAAAQRGELPPGVMGVGTLKAGDVTVLRGILPKLDESQQTEGIHPMDSGSVFVFDQHVLYLSRDGIGQDLLEAYRVQAIASILFYAILLGLTLLFYYSVFRTVRRLEGWVKGKSGKERTRSKRISGRQLPMHGFTRIISGIEKIYSDLIHTEKEVERKTKLEALGVLFTKVLHDIKNNLSSIKIYQYLLKTTQDESRRHELTQKVDDGMQDISLQVQDMLDFVRGSRSSLREHVRIRDLFNGLKTEYQAKAQVEGVRFDIQLDDRIAERTIHVDMVRIVTALKHLIVNAFEEVVASGRDHPRVDVKLGEDRTDLLIEISDNGRVIPESVQPRMFTPFVSDGKENGNGIGTSVAKEYIEAQEGQIGFQTSEKGTMFDVRLPFSNGKG